MMMMAVMVMMMFTQVICHTLVQLKSGWTGKEREQENRENFMLLLLLLFSVGCQVE